jgi:hypothetical protein
LQDESVSEARLQSRSGRLLNSMPFSDLTDAVADAIDGVEFQLKRARTL